MSNHAGLVITFLVSGFWFLVVFGETRRTRNGE